MSSGKLEEGSKAGIFGQVSKETEEQAVWTSSRGKSVPDRGHGKHEDIQKTRAYGTAQRTLFNVL